MDTWVALEPTAHITAKYDRPFYLTFIVKLAEYQLSTELHVKNMSTSDDLEFQALFHNYIRVPASEVLIFPLEHQSYYDKTALTEEERSTLKEERRAAVDVKRFTDFVYPNASQKYEVTWPQGIIEIKATNLKDVVVWNPQEMGSQISDMEDGGWYDTRLRYFLDHILLTILPGRGLFVSSQVMCVDLSTSNLEKLGFATKVCLSCLTEGHNCEGSVVLMSRKSHCCSVYTTLVPLAIHFTLTLGELASSRLAPIPFGTTSMIASAALAGS
jgi:hypothetical protein